jgi:O-antigen/teichoic acid export membrane protein
MLNNARKIGVIHITLYNFMGRGVFFLFLFFVSYYASRHLSDEQFGIVQYVTWTVNFSWLLFSFGGSSVLQRYAASTYDSKNLRKVLGYGVLSASASIMAALIGWFIYIQFNPEVRYFPGSFLFLVLHFITSFAQVVIQSLFRYKAIFYINLISAIAGSIFLVSTIQQFKGASCIWMYIIVNAIQTIFFLIIIIKDVIALSQQLHVSSDKSKDTSTITKQQWIKTSFYFGISGLLSSLVWQRPEIFFIKKYLGFDDVAFYSVALNCIALLLEPLKMMAGAMLSYFSSISHAKAEVDTQFYRYVKHYAWLGIFVGMVLWFNAETIVTLIYTIKYAQSAKLVQILLIGFIPAIFVHVVMQLLVSLKQTKYLIRQDVFMAICFLTAMYICLTLLPFSLYSLSIVKSSLFIILTITAVSYITKYLHIPLPHRSLLLSTLLAFSICFLVSLLPNGNSWFMFKIIICSTIYFYISYTTALIDKEIVKGIWAETKKILRIEKR